MAVFGRHRVARRFDHHPAPGRDAARDQHGRGGVVLQNVVDNTHHAAEAGHDKIRGDAHDHHRAGTDAQDQKTGENDNMHHPRLQVARVAILTQPDLEHVVKTPGDAVKPHIRRGPYQRRRPQGHDVGEYGDPDNRDQDR